MQEDITTFAGDYAWLSNFHPVVVMLDGVSYPSVEHAYQAAKTAPKNRDKFRFGSSSIAKRYGRLVKDLPADWQTRKLVVMRDLLEQKFKSPALRRKLLDTGTVLLEEGNHWGDTYWGVCRGKGHNHLGKMLMALRAELQKECRR